MATFISHSPGETHAFGSDWGRRAQAGSLLGLMGDLGTGKTQFVKGFAEGLGVRCYIVSPTFTLVSEYPEARLPLYHLDFYRLSGGQDVVAAGLESYLQPDGVSVIEWFDRWDGWLPRQWTRFRFAEIDDCSRRIDYEVISP